MAGPQPFFVKPFAAATSNGSGGACFMAGSRIAASNGAVRIEDLSVGAMVMTVSGESRPVRWLGHRGIDCTRYRDPTVVWPIRIRAGAFAEQQPTRDLWVSPGHSILVDGVLIQAGKLVNGATIVQVPRERVDYWHVELDSHDILLSEGLASESYLDTGNRTAFANGGAFLEAYPDFQPKHANDTCVPLHLDGPMVERARAALLERAKQLGYATTQDSDVHVMADGRRIEAMRLAVSRLAFVLPASCSTIELHCRAFVPAHFDPASTDMRSLGVRVRRLQLDGSEVALHDETSFASGWHALERGADGNQWRWSHDRVGLPAGTRLIVIDAAAEGHYWAERPHHDMASTG
jgi:hypothetical protein